MKFIEEKKRRIPRRAYSLKGARVEDRRGCRQIRGATPRAMYSQGALTSVHSCLLSRRSTNKELLLLPVFIAPLPPYSRPRECVNFLPRRILILPLGVREKNSSGPLMKLEKISAFLSRLTSRAERNEFSIAFQFATKVSPPLFFLSSRNFCTPLFFFTGYNRKYY